MSPALSFASFLSSFTFQVAGNTWDGGSIAVTSPVSGTFHNCSGTTQTVKVTVPLLNNQRFLRLAVTCP